MPPALAVRTGPRMVVDLQGPLLYNGAASVDRDPEAF